MKNDQEIISRISDPNNWPSFERPSFLDELADLADAAFAKETTEGYLASLLIYHQLCEEMILLLIEDAIFFINLSIHPQKMSLMPQQRLTFGQLMKRLKELMSFDNKEEFIGKCKELNDLRNSIAHRLTEHRSLSELKNNTSEVKNLYYEIFDMFDVIHDNFKVCFKDFRKDVFVDYLEEHENEGGIHKKLC